MDKILSNAQIVCKKVLDIKKGETFLLITNPRNYLLRISKALAQAAKELGAVPADTSMVPRKNVVNLYIITQPPKTPGDFMEDYVYKAIKQAPNIIVSIPVEKLGKDKIGLQKPYKKGKLVRDDLLFFLFDTKQSRGFWTPHITLDTWERTLDVDYDLIRKRSEKLIGIVSGADKVHIATNKGTDLTMSFKGRTLLPDNGDIRKPGGSGNIPCGEAFGGPKVGSVEGKWVLDGMIPLRDGSVLFLDKDPLTITWENGYIKSIEGKYAKKLASSIAGAEAEARRLFTGEKAEEYAKNARHCGELGIGLNPNAKVVGTVLEDEKVIKTCHMAIGRNYESDASALIHLDGVMHNPTIDVTKAGKMIRIMQEGELLV